MADPPLWLFADQLGPARPRTASTPPRDRARRVQRALRRKPFHRQKLHLVLSGDAPPGRGARRPRPLPPRRHLPGSAEQVGRRCSCTSRPRTRRPSSSAPAQGGAGRRGAADADVRPARKEFERLGGDRERFRMEDFYRAQRRRFDVLMEAGEPGRRHGGTTTTQPRAPAARRPALDVPGPWQPDARTPSTRGPHRLDRLDLRLDRRPRRAALVRRDRAEARAGAGHFLAQRLPHFGPHEDAMLTRTGAMAHSLLSVPLNLGVLAPAGCRRAPPRTLPGRERAARTARRASSGRCSGWRRALASVLALRPGYVDGTISAPHALPDWWRALDPTRSPPRCLRTALAGVRDRG